MDVASESELRICLEQVAEQGPVECLVSETVVKRTSGSGSIGAVYSVTLPTSRRLDAVLRFVSPVGCFVWDHSGAEPTGTVDVLRITAPDGVVADSRLRILGTCVQEWRAGVEGGSAATVVRGIAFTGDGLPNLVVNVEDSDGIRLGSSGVGTATMAGATADANPRKVVRTLPELKEAVASGVGRYVVDRTITVTTSGAIAAQTIMALIPPDDGTKLDLDIEFSDGAALIWDHSGTEPAGAITMVSFDLGNGGQAPGSLVVFRKPRMYEFRSGVLGGNASTSVQGFTTINRALSGESDTTLRFIDPDFETASAGASSIAFGHNPSGPVTYEVEGGRIKGPLAMDLKFICEPANCKQAGATVVGTHLIGTSATPRCFKTDFQSVVTFVGGSWTSCYGDVKGTGSGSMVYLDGVIGKAMPPTLSGNDAVFVVSGNSNLRGSMMLQGAGPSSADLEAIVLVNSGFLGHYDLEVNALDCASRFWFNPAGDSASGWLRFNTTPATQYGSGRITLSGPSGTAGAECGPRDLILNASDLAPERDNAIPLVLSAGAKRIEVNSYEGRSRMPAAFAGDCQNREHGFAVTITDDTAVGACTDAGADGVLDGGGSAVSSCKCNPAGDSGDGAWSSL